MYEQWGAHDVNGAVRFDLFIPGPTQYSRGGDPQIASLHVFGEFQSKLGHPDWSQAHALPLTPQSRGGGTLYSVTTPALPEGYYQYKYVVRFHGNGTPRIVGDPCARYVGGDFENAGIVVGGSTPQDNVVPPLNPRLPIHDLVIYELLIDDFTAEYRGGRPPIDALLDKLDYIAGLGFNAIEFMPWTAWPGAAFSWGYNPFLYFAVENKYVDDPQQPAEKLSRLKRLIRECHQRGLHVIKDGVFNHAQLGDANSGFPYYWLYRDPGDCPFVGAFSGADFPGDLDFANACTDDFIADVCRYWIDVFRIDGLRLDYTRGFYTGKARVAVADPTAPDAANQQPAGLTRLVWTIDQHVAAQGQQNFAVTLEHIEGYSAIDVTNRVGAASCWYDPFHSVSSDALKRGWIDAGIMRLLNAAQDFGAGRAPTTYIENHDHAQVASHAGGRRQWFRTQPWVIALLTAPGAPLIHSSQEFGDDYWMPEYGQETAEAHRVVPRPVRWGGCDDETGRRLRWLYGRLIQIRRAHPALRSANFYPDHWEGWQTRFDPAGYGVDLEKGVVIYHRWGSAGNGTAERFIVVLNFSPWTQRVDIPFAANGRWEDLLSGWQVEVDNWRLPGQEIGGNWGHVFWQG